MSSQFIAGLIKLSFYTGVLLLLWSIDIKLQTVVDLLTVQTAIQLDGYMPSVPTGAKPPAGLVVEFLPAKPAAPCLVLDK